MLTIVKVVVGVTVYVAAANLTFAVLSAIENKLSK